MAEHGCVLAACVALLGQCSCPWSRLIAAGQLKDTDVRAHEAALPNPGRTEQEGRLSGRSRRETEHNCSMRTRASLSLRVPMASDTQTAEMHMAIETRTVDTSASFRPWKRLACSPSSRTHKYGTALLLDSPSDTHQRKYCLSCEQANTSHRARRSRTATVCGDHRPQRPTERIAKKEALQESVSRLQYSLVASPLRRAWGL